MNYREAIESDVDQLIRVRNSVNENRLSDPNLVSKADCIDYLTNRGKGWVCEVDNSLVGFSIVDLTESNVWALFVQPDFENRGIGSRLYSLMLKWYFANSDKTVWLSTDPGTRAQTFYRKMGWSEIGKLDNGEIKFELTKGAWLANDKS